MHWKTKPSKISATSGHCPGCGMSMAGEDGYYFPRTKQTFCLDCGEGPYKTFLNNPEIAEDCDD